jgi:hypothetical protein
VQPTGLLGAVVEGSRTGAYDVTSRCVRRIGYSVLDDCREIELAVAIRVGAGKLEKGPRRRIQHM